MFTYFSIFDRTKSYDFWNYHIAFLFHVSSVSLWHFVHLLVCISIIFLRGWWTILLFSLNNPTTTIDQEQKKQSYSALVSSPLLRCPLHLLVDFQWPVFFFLSLKKSLLLNPILLSIGSKEPECMILTGIPIFYKEISKTNLKVQNWLYIYIYMDSRNLDWQNKA